MARPKGPEETSPLHTRLSTSQLAGFREYLRRQQAQVKHTGVQLTDAAVLRGMVLRCLDLEGIAHQGPQQELLSTAPRPAPSAPIAPSAPAPSSAATVSKATAEIAEPPAPPKVDTAPPAAAEPEAKPSRAAAKSAPAPSKTSAAKAPSKTSAKPTTKTSAAKAPSKTSAKPTTKTSKAAKKGAR